MKNEYISKILIVVLNVAVQGFVTGTIAYIFYYSSKYIFPNYMVDSCNTDKFTWVYFLKCAWIFYAIFKSKYYYDNP